MAHVPSGLLLTSVHHTRVRDARLLERELQAAQRTEAIRVLCPCRVCNRSICSRLLIRTVRNHLQRFDRHPTQRGRMKSCDVDDSDNKWDAHLEQVRTKL